jgi:3-hydroxyacyl-CoA dehydrogenase/enoyl-CoA hydratase/3-hydroxybutyryl-CoA epimerase
MVLAMANEAAVCLEDGVVREPRDVDIAMVFGTGFPPFRGGLLRYADSIGLPVLVDRLARLADAQGERFRPAALLRDMVREERRFYPA